MDFFFLICYRFILLLFLLIIFTYVSNGHGSSSAKVLVVSLDGFRHDYFDIADKSGINLKYFKEIFSKGTKADHINNLFITRTFPNHMSIITGCYEETHGIIDNGFFDPILNETFCMKNITQQFQSKWFSAVEPIWVTNQKNGHKSAIVYWPGQLAPFQDKYYPSYSFGIYNVNVSFYYKIDIMLNWLSNHDTTLGLLYHPHPDFDGHKSGANSSSILRSLSEIDSAFGYLLRGIAQRGLVGVLNVVVLSDHGMSDISPLRKVIMDNYVKEDWYYHHRQESYTMWGLWPRDNVNVTSLFAVVQAVPHTVSYLKEQIPERWHYANNARVAPIIVIADEGWILVHGNNDTVTDRGAHGYRVSAESMRGIFVAWGPNIEVNNQSQTAVSEIDVFPLVADILKLESVPDINGSLARVRWLLASKASDDNVFSSLIMVCALALLCALAVCIVVSCAHHHARSVHLQRVNQTYALQTGKHLRRRQSKDRPRTGWISFNHKKQTKRPKAPSADTAFLLESSSGVEEDDILGDVRMGAHKVAS